MYVCVSLYYPFPFCVCSYIKSNSNIMLCVSYLFVFQFDSSVCVFILIQIESGKAECRRPICPLSIPLISLCVPRGPCVASLEGASGPKDLSLSVCVCVY